MIPFGSLIIGAGMLAMLFSFWKTTWINKQDEGTDRMKQIGASIAEGAMAFLKAEYRVLTIFVIASVLSRGLRFFVIASLLYWFGDPIRTYIEGNLGKLAILFVISLFAGFVFIKWLI